MLSTGRAAAVLGVTVKTLQRWEREGRLLPFVRTDSNRRLYTEVQLREFLGIQRNKGAAPHRLVAYCRVSNTAQKPDLLRAYTACEAIGRSYSKYSKKAARHAPDA